MKKRTELQLLTDTWYKRLAAEGFKDIENRGGSLNSASPRSFRSKDPIQRQAIEDYYSICYQFLIEYKFTTEIEKVMWEYHTNGISIRNISKILTGAKVKKISKTSVGEIIRNLEITMKNMYLSI